VNLFSARPADGVAPLGRRAAYTAELIGTFGLVLILTVSAPSPIGIGGPNFAVVGLVHAFALMILIAALGGACGAHFNPAVTVGCSARGASGSAMHALTSPCSLSAPCWRCCS